MINRRLLHDTSMATTKAVVDLFRWSDDAEYREAFNTVFPAVEAGLLYALEAHQRELVRLAKLPPPSEN